eukprot:1267180-Amorphochlora_amoeboformis.AAC.1
MRGKLADELSDGTSPGHTHCDSVISRTSPGRLMAQWSGLGYTFYQRSCALSPWVYIYGKDVSSPLLPRGAVPRLKTRQDPRMGIHMRVRGTNADEEIEDLGDEDIDYHMSALRDDLEVMFSKAILLYTITSDNCEYSASGNNSDEDDGIENDDHKPPNTSSAQEMEGIVQSSTAEVDFRPGKVVSEVVPMEELHLGEGIAVPNGGRDLLPPP